MLFLFQYTGQKPNSIRRDDGMSMVGLGYFQNFKIIGIFSENYEIFEDISYSDS